jgi:hypothetical protein
MYRSPVLPRLLTFVGCLAASPVGAETSFEMHVNHWTIQSNGDSCSAQNRPLSELGTVPINTMIVVAEPGGDLSLAMAFWPGALSDADSAMTLRVAAHGNFDLPADTLLEPWTVLRTSRRLPDDLLEAFISYDTTPLYTMVVAPDVSDTETVIDIQDMPRVMGELRRCLTLLSDAP